MPTDTQRLWTCKLGCGSRWPSATTVDAYRNHIRANKVHPHKTCR